jgi:hypothetical protein
MYYLGVLAVDRFRYVDHEQFEDSRGFCYGASVLQIAFGRVAQSTDQPEWTGNLAFICHAGPKDTKPNFIRCTSMSGFGIRRNGREALHMAVVDTMDRFVRWKDWRDPKKPRSEVSDGGRRDWRISDEHRSALVNRLARRRIWPTRF